MIFFQMFKTYKFFILGAVFSGLLAYHYFDKKMAVNAAVQEVTQKYEEIFKVWRAVNLKEKEKVQKDLVENEQKYAELKANSQIQLNSLNVKLDRVRAQLNDARTRASKDSPSTTGIDGTGENSIPGELVEEIRYLVGETVRLQNKIQGLQDYINALEPYMEK